MWKTSISLKTNKLNKFQFNDRVNFFWAIVNRLDSPRVLINIRKFLQNGLLQFGIILTVISPGEFLQHFHQITGIGKLLMGYSIMSYVVGIPLEK